ncbi:MAG: LamG domain-containing protein, partial [bacterium]|nr:LamG domain-containing protein [bacterium]
SRVYKYIQYMVKLTSEDSQEGTTLSPVLSEVSLKFSDTPRFKVAFDWYRDKGALLGGSSDGRSFRSVPVRHFETPGPVPVPVSDTLTASETAKYEWWKCRVKVEDHFGASTVAWAYPILPTEQELNDLSINTDYRIVHPTEVLDFENNAVTVFGLEKTSTVTYSLGVDEGAIFSDDFGGLLANNWTPVNGSWTIVSQELNTDATGNNWIRRSGRFGTEIFNFKVRFLTGQGGDIAARFDLRDDNDNNISFAMYTEDSTYAPSGGFLGQTLNGNWTYVELPAPHTITYDEWYDVKIEVSANNVKSFLNGSAWHNYTLQSSETYGEQRFGATKANVRFDDVMQGGHLANLSGTVSGLNSIQDAYVRCIVRNVDYVIQPEDRLSYSLFVPMDPNYLFQSGFESGDLSDWSSNSLGTGSEVTTYPIFGQPPKGDYALQLRSSGSYVQKNISLQGYSWACIDFKGGVWNLAGSETVNLDVYTGGQWKNGVFQFTVSDNGLGFANKSYQIPRGYLTSDFAFRLQVNASEDACFIVDEVGIRLFTVFDTGFAADLKLADGRWASDCGVNAGYEASGLDPRPGAFKHGKWTRMDTDLSPIRGERITGIALVFDNSADEAGAGGGAVLNGMFKAYFDDVVLGRRSVRIENSLPVISQVRLNEGDHGNWTRSTRPDLTVTPDGTWIDIDTDPNRDRVHGGARSFDLLSANENAVAELSHFDILWEVQAAESRYHAPLGQFRDANQVYQFNNRTSLRWSKEEYLANDQVRVQLTPKNQPNQQPSGDTQYGEPVWSSWYRIVYEQDTGVAISSIVDTVVSGDLSQRWAEADRIWWKTKNEYLNLGCNLRFKLRSGESQSELLNRPFLGPSGSNTWYDLGSAPGGEQEAEINSSQHRISYTLPGVGSTYGVERYMQYLVELTPGKSGGHKVYSPQIDEVGIACSDAGTFDVTFKWYKDNGALLGGSADGASFGGAMRTKSYRGPSPYSDTLTADQTVKYHWWKCLVEVMDNFGGKTSAVGWVDLPSQAGYEATGVEPSYRIVHPNELVGFEDGSTTVYNVDKTGAVSYSLSTAGVVDAMGPIGWWRFETGSGGTAKDSSGNGSSGSITGASWTTGMTGKALYFDGNDYVNIDGMAGNLSNGDDFAMTAWFKTGYKPGAVYGHVLFSAHTGSGDNVIRIGTGKNGGIYLSHNTDLERGSGYADNKWHYLAVSVAGDSVLEIPSGTPKVWVDGNPITGFATSAVSWDEARKFSLGQEWDSTSLTDFWRGSIDDVRVYNHTLSEDQVLNQYQDSAEGVVLEPLEGTRMLKFAG